VRIPAELAQLPAPAGHDLTGRSERSPLVVSWQALVDTAFWMNQRERDGTGSDSDWERRLQDVRLELRGQDGTFEHAEFLTIDGILHLVGMVSAGKSTLLDVLAVYAARSGLHTTLVVGDVRSVLRKVELFTKLGIEAAPVLGSSTLSTHVERQHWQEQGRGKLCCWTTPMAGSTTCRPRACSTGCGARRGLSASAKLRAQGCTPRPKTKGPMARMLTTTSTTSRTSWMTVRHRSWPAAPICALAVSGVFAPAILLRGAS
jgi:hypothetical protein